jgi:hypothetical protein
MQDILKLNKWEGDNLEHNYNSPSLRWLEEKASEVHTYIEEINGYRWRYYLSTIIKGNKKNSNYQLDILISKSEKYKHKENKHEQEIYL